VLTTNLHCPLSDLVLQVDAACISSYAPSETLPFLCVVHTTLNYLNIHQNKKVFIFIIRKTINIEFKKKKQSNRQ
jgi:hypothetical protein